MSSIIENINSSSDDSGNPPQLIFSESSLILLGAIEDMLGDLVNRIDLCHCDDEFYQKFRRFLDLYDILLQEVIYSSGISIVCSAGCSDCCSHWVEDVNSFEGSIISRYLHEHHPDIIDSVISSFRKDTEVFNSLRSGVGEKTVDYLSVSDDISDTYDMLLLCFYQLKRPCALLDDNGCCIVYPVRPLTCRDYLNVRDAAICLPERIIEEEKATLIMYLSDVVSQRIEVLHRRFDHGSNNTSLRTLLVSSLELS